MDQKTIQSGGIFSGVIVIFCGVLVSPVAVGLTLSYPHELWWLGAVLCICCMLMIVGGIQNIRSANQKERMANQERERIATELAQQKAMEAFATQGIVPTEIPAAVPLRPEVLAHWSFSANEWKQFMALEKRRRMEGAFFEAFGIIILGTIIIMLARESVFSIALSVSTVIALVIGALRYLLNMRSYGQTLPKNEVTITHQSVLINDKLNPYRSDTFWLDKLELKEGNPDVLEFTYAWITSKKKRTSDEMRIPIPKGKKEEAKQIIKKILNQTR
jgi:hypothetical protein